MGQAPPQFGFSLPLLQAGLQGQTFTQEHFGLVYGMLLHMSVEYCGNLWNVISYMVFAKCFNCFSQLKLNHIKPSKSPGNRSQISNDLNTFEGKRLPGFHGFEKAPAPSVPIEH